MHAPVPDRDTLAISKFKATCLAVLEKVRRTGQPVVITKRGVPIAEVVPPPLPEPGSGSAFGALAGKAREISDILEPLGDELWEVLR